MDYAEKEKVFQALTSQLSEYFDNVEKEKVLQALTGQLSEHFDNVKVFVNSDNSGLTLALTAERGNYYSIQGQIQEYMTKTEQIEREDASSSYFEQGNGGGD